MLRDYQKTSIDSARTALKTNRSVCIQGATGSGKSIIFTEILSSINTNKKRAWVIVPRTDLVNQSSQHLKKHGTPHGIINANINESRAYNIHVVSKDTLMRRLDKIKNPPDVIIIDECHIAIEQQKRISNAFPKSKIIGFTATPEIQDGRGLSTQAGGIYDTLVLGESIPDLTERDFLTPLRYYAPELKGIENLKRTGTDINAHDLDEFLKQNRIYGKVIDHYREVGQGKPALVFCRDVKSAYETAERFQRAGFEFYCIEGKMSDKTRRTLIQGLTDGKIQGLTNCEIVTYGIDVPRVEVGILLRPTYSRALYMQMIGRLLRPFEIRYCPYCDKKYQGEICKCGAIGHLIYKKYHAIVLDHVNNLREHSISVDMDGNPIPLHYEKTIDWNFHGKEKRKKILCGICDNYDRCELSTKPIAKTCKFFRPEKREQLRYCIKCGLYFTGEKCKCGYEPEVKQRAELEEVSSIDLKEVKYLKLSERPLEEQREYQDRINNNIFLFKSKKEIDSKAVEDMIKISEDLKNNILWVYWKLTPDERISVNVSLLNEIARIKGFRKGWVYFQREKIKERLESINKLRSVI